MAPDTPDTPRRRRLLVAAVAGLVAVGAFALVFTQLHPAGSGTPAGTASTAASAKAVVALFDIQVGDQLSSTNTAVVDYPVVALPSANVYFADTRALTAAAWYSTVQLPRGQLILTTQLTQELAPAKLPPVVLQAGDVAMSIPYDQSKDAGGFIQQDDYIDILVDDPTAKLVHYAFQGVHVLHVGDRGVQPAGSAVATTTGAAAATTSLLLVEIPRQQAAALAFVIDQNYTIRYVIRPHDQQTQQALPNSGPVGQANWLTIIAG